MTEEIKQQGNGEHISDDLAANQAERTDKQPEATSSETLETGDNTCEALNREIEQLKATLEENQNRLLRMQADFDNFRKRSRQEREELVTFATEGLLTKLLPVLDNFDRAVGAEGDNSDMLAGVHMIQRQLMEVLTGEGLEIMTACGCEFDPNFHQAVVMEPSEEVADNHIIAEWQKGYLVKGKVIRPAMVKVAQN